MRILLDTHAALWWWADHPELGADIRAAMGDVSNEIYFSSVSAYEMLLKNRLKKLDLPGGLVGEALSRAILEEGWHFLPLTVGEASSAASLEHPHRNPFDRMLAVQSKIGNFSLGSRDPFFRDLDLDVIW